MDVTRLSHELDLVNRTNPEYVDQLYQQYLRDPHSVDERWALFFAGFEAASGNGGRGAAAAITAPAERQLGIYDLIHSYRELGYRIANLDPLGTNPTTHPLLEPTEFGFVEADLDRVVETPSFKGCDRARLRDLVALLRSTYCGTLGVEYLATSDKAQRDWLQERMEPTRNAPQLTADERRMILQQLTAAEGFEQFLHTKYVGQKRFSLEGSESLIPLLDALIEAAGSIEVDEIAMGMAHRGRLNVLAHILRKPYEMIFSEFQGTLLPAGVQGDGDVKYHLGYSRDCKTRGGRTIHLSLCSNPSHLEAVNPVVEGIVRAKQEHWRDAARERVVPVLIHGDAAFTGQGIVSETLALTALDGYRTGGTIHIIINNQIGFTTSPRDYRATCYPSDVAKIIEAPVLHVNADDPEAAVQAARLAMGFRNTFKRDVIIDLVCYRRHGHNETDDPRFTQPTLYEKIAAHPTVRHVYGQRLIAAGVVTADTVAADAAALRELFEDAINYARDFMPRQQVFALGGLWQGLRWAGDDWSAQTAVPLDTLRRVAERTLAFPSGFTPYPKAKRVLEQRAAMLAPDGQVDWAAAEMFAFATLLLEGTDVRLSGQDAGRGTFSQRHAVLRDVRTGDRHVPLNHLRPEQGRFEVIDSMLSEAAVLGFEWGYSSADPHNLVLWEAQFGDFANGAQVIIDQFIAAAESKWQRMSGLVLLLPHGYEGQGPEHSSARLERYLQLCAENNLQVCNLSTPAQYFHALRRQMHRNFRKPLILMTPKSLLRHRLVVSAPADLAEGSFRLTIDEVDPLPREQVRRVLFCSGKVYYDLLLARREREIDDIAIARIEQLYPFPSADVAAIVAAYPAAREVFWVQEEPWNMGAWHCVSHPLRRALPADRSLRYVGRDAAASPASGSYKMHQAEEDELLNYALRRTHGG